MLYAKLNCQACGVVIEMRFVVEPTDEGARFDLHDAEFWLYCPVCSSAEPTERKDQ